MAPRIDIDTEPNKYESLRRKLRVTYQRYLDASVPHRGMRWALFAILCLLYVARVVSYGGFHIITYGLFIHILAQLLMLMTPLLDPDDSFVDGGGELPTTNSNDEEFRPFIPKVQEFIVWKNMTQAVAICLFATIFTFLDIPVYWPILVLYAATLFVVNMGSRIKHMWQHGYVPWNAGKPKFVPKNNVGKRTV